MQKGYSCSQLASLSPEQINPKVMKHRKKLESHKKDNITLCIFILTPTTIDILFQYGKVILLPFQNITCPLCAEKI